MSTLNPRVDFAFKILFGTKENKDILIAFINAIVDEKDQIEDLILLNPYNNKEHSTDKLSILDIKATDKNGRQYNIEMQITDQVYYNQRALYYWSRFYTSQLHEGNSFSDLKKTISINVLNFNYFDNEPTYHNIFKLLHVDSHKNYFEDIELHFIELNKYDADLNNMKTALDRWVNFLKKAHKYDAKNLPPQLNNEPAISKAFQQLTKLSLDVDEREIYEARLKWLRDESAKLQKAHEKGIEQGIEQGRIKEKINIAIKQLKRGVQIEWIIEDTGFSQEEILLLIKEHGL